MTGISVSCPSSLSRSILFVFTIWLSSHSSSPVVICSFIHCVLEYRPRSSSGSQLIVRISAYLIVFQPSRCFHLSSLPSASATVGIFSKAITIPTNKPVQIRNSTRLTTEKYVNITANQIARIMTVAAIPALKNLSLHFISTLILSIRTPFTDYIFRFNYITRTI